MQTKKLRWGIISTAKIAREKLIPAIQQSEHCEVVAVSSRDASQAAAFASANNIARSYGDYHQLLADPDIDIVYNPLPNHLHVPWTIHALEAGKHVLCEKPIGLDVADTEKLIAAAKKYPHLRVMEAFMYRFHPQWATAKKMLEDGKIGHINSIEAVFTYFNRDPKNVRNMPGIGGGGLLDIGCYCISACRYLFDREPNNVVGKLAIDEDFQVDKHAHGLLDFGDAQASVYCSTQSEPVQRVYVSGEHGGLLIEYPFYQPDDCGATLRFYHDREEEVIEFEPTNHYTLQVDALARAIATNKPVPTPLSDALANMKVIEGLFTSAETGSWVNPKA